MTITDKEAKEMVVELFDKIRDSESTKNILSITSGMTQGGLIEKKMPPISKFPRLKFKISSEDIKELVKFGILTSENKISKNAANNFFKFKKELTPFEKVLYSILWKNGDLGKEHHLIAGVLNLENAGKGGIVFHEFGKYISGQTNYILDQHTLRCLAVYKADPDQISKARKLQEVKKSKYHEDLLKSYKEYYYSIESRLQQEDMQDFFYHMDRLLFGVGKVIKFRGK